MKHVTIFVVAFILFSVAGCDLAFRNSNYNDGYNFAGENVKKIVIGKTTENELIKMLGGPYAKFEVSQDEEEWQYVYTTGTETRMQGFLTDEDKIAGRGKSLFIRLKNGIVTNFAYAESATHQGW